jgi:hypothetical protein
LGDEADEQTHAHGGNGVRKGVRTLYYTLRYFWKRVLTPFPADQLIEQIASLELLPEVGDFLIDLVSHWHLAVKSRSLDHGVSFQPSLGQLMKRNFIHQQDTPPFSFQLEHIF